MPITHWLDPQTFSTSHSIMKVLVTGATGTIGRAVLDKCLKHSGITSIIALVRRELSSDFIPSDNPNRDKFKAIIVKDFGDWSHDILDHHKDAEAMIW
jgi:FlaA1/EpsC-like NDP-sugar epimerase